MIEAQKGNYLCIMLIIVIGVLGSSNPATAQDRTILKLQDAIDIALEQSYQMKTLRLSLVQAEENLTAAKGRFKTNADLSLDLPSWSESVSEIAVQDALPVFNTTSRLRYQGIFDINQPLPTDGRLTLRSQVYHRDVQTFKTDLTEDVKRREVYTSLSLRFQQPLFTINRLKLGLKNANLNYERTSRVYKRSELDIIYIVTQSFFNLYRATRQAEIAEDDMQQQQELYDLATQKFKAGLIPEVEALQMEVDLAESKNDLVAAQGNLERAEDFFKQLIGLKLADQVGVQTDFDYTPMIVDLDRAIQLALANRSEMRENEIAVELAEIDVKEADARSEIRADISAFYDITGISDPFLPYGSSPGELWNSSIDDMKRRPNNRGVVFTLSMPLWDWGVNSAEVAAAEASLRETELGLAEQMKTIAREVRDVVGRLNEAESRLEVLRKNQEVAQRAFDISLERFNNGDITGQELALDRDRFTQAKFSFLNAYIDYMLATADLKRKTMWDFENNRSLVEGRE
jgi:outer membrane protein TolC